MNKNNDSVRSLLHKYMWFTVNIQSANYYTCHWQQRNSIQICQSFPVCLLSIWRRELSKHAAKTNEQKMKEKIKSVLRRRNLRLLGGNSFSHWKAKGCKKLFNIFYLHSCKSKWNQRHEQKLSFEKYTANMQSNVTHSRLQSPLKTPSFLISGNIIIIFCVFSLSLIPQFRRCFGSRTN